MENTKPKKHNITFYVTTRVKITNVPGDTHIEAINFAESAFRPDIDRVLTHGNEVPLLDGMAIAYAEPGDELSNYLVDEVGDDEFENTRVYQPDLILDRDIVECDGGRSQFDQMKALLEDIAITFQAGARTEDIDWDDMTPKLDKALNLLGRDRIRDLEIAEAYLNDEVDLEDEDDEQFVVVRYLDHKGDYFRASIPEEVRPHSSKAFDSAHSAFAYLQEAHAKMIGETDDESLKERYPLIRVVLCKLSNKGVFRSFSYKE